MPPRPTHTYMSQKRWQTPPNMPASFKLSRPQRSLCVCEDAKIDVTDWRRDELVEDGDVNIPKTGTSDSLIERLDEPDRDDTANTNDHSTDEEQNGASVGQHAGTEWRCDNCGATKTPLKRKGQNGPQTLCNACGVKPYYKPKPMKRLRSAGRDSDSFDDPEMISALKNVWKRMQRASRRETQHKKIATRRKRASTGAPNSNHCYIQTPIYCKHGKSIYTQECGRCK